MTAEAPKSPPVSQLSNFNAARYIHEIERRTPAAGSAAYVDSLTRHPSEIPGIDLYTDQVTTFMDSHLNTSKWLGEDKILTKP